MLAVVDIDRRGLTDSHFGVSLWRTTNNAFVRTQRLTGEVESRDGNWMMRSFGNG